MSRVPKNIQSVVRSQLARDMAFCFIYQNSKFVDVGPRRYRIKPSSSVLDPTFSVDFDSETGQQGGNHGGTSNDSYWEIETGGRGILSNLPDSSYFVWVSGVNSGNDAATGSTTYCERPSGTPIWKFTTHGDSVGEDTPCFIHRDNSGTLTRVHSTTSIEDNALHLVGFTKKGTSLRYFVDGKFTNAVTLSGNDVLDKDDPSIGIDLDSASNSVVSGMMFSHYGWARAITDDEARSLYDQKTRWDLFKKDSIIAISTGAASAQITADIDEAGDTTAAAMAVIVGITANTAEEGDTTTAAISALSSSAITANIAEAGDTTSAAMAPVIGINANISEAGDTTTATLATIVSINANVNEDGDTTAAAISTSVAPAEITANVNEAGDTTSAPMAVIVSINANVNEDGDTTAAAISTGIAPAQITANIAEDGDTTAAQIATIVSINANVSELGDTTVAEISTGGELIAANAEINIFPAYSGRSAISPAYVSKVDIS